jgi:nucleotide-binding universal stress UspA family protein
MPTSAPLSRLLVPFDGSDPARAALQVALTLAPRGSSLTLLNVVDDSPVMRDEAIAMVVTDPAPLLDALDAEGAALLDEAAALCRAAGIETRTRVVHETPVAGILTAIREDGSTLVVMGTHARSGIARAFLGSTTEGVLRASPIPVLAVPLHKSE